MTGMNPRHLPLALVTVVAAAAAPVGAATKPTPRPVAGTFTFTGTPVGGDVEKYEKLRVAFNLNRTDILGRDVKVKVAGRATTTTHVSTKVKGRKSDLYSAKLEESVRLAWSRTYTVTVQIRKGPVRSYRVKLNRPQR
jgi:hypothetical protein